MVMPPFSTYRLTFRAPLHIGERGVGLEVTRTHVPADTLFSALCSVWRELYGVNGLRNDLLDWFTEAEGGNEPFVLSSAFPFAGGVRFFPKPLMRLTSITINDGDEKSFKRVRFVSEGVFTAMVTGSPLPFHQDACINGYTTWVTEDERTSLTDWTDDETGDILLWKTHVVPRVTLDRITSASEIWHFGEARFAEGVGLWFAVDFNPEHGDLLCRRFHACMRLLGDTGLGGERGAGRGLFDVEPPKDASLPAVNEPEQFLTLSPVCPKASEIASLTGNGAAYELMPRRGWVTSPEASNLRRKMVWMLAEGSVLLQPDTFRIGQLINVKPDACPHDVWRYGYAFPVGVKIS
jgi:CRISPR-associated protein Csm4